MSVFHCDIFKEELHSRSNSAIFHDPIYSFRLHEIRKCLKTILVSNMVQVQNPAELLPAEPMTHSRQSCELHVCVYRIRAGDMTQEPGFTGQVESNQVDDWLIRSECNEQSMAECISLI